MWMIPLSSSCVRVRNTVSIMLKQGGALRSVMLRERGLVGEGVREKGRKKGRKNSKKGEYNYNTGRVDAAYIIAIPICTSLTVVDHT